MSRFVGTATGSRHGIERESTGCGRRIDLLLMRVGNGGAGACSATICGNGPNAAPAPGERRGLSALKALSHTRSGDRAVVHKQASKSRAKSDEFLPPLHRVPQPDDAAVERASTPREPSPLSRAPHRTGAKRHGLADISLTKPDRGHVAGAHGDGQTHGCRRMREVRRPDSGLRDPEPMREAKRASPRGDGPLDGAVDGARQVAIRSLERVRAARVAA